MRPSGGGGQSSAARWHILTSTHMSFSEKRREDTPDAIDVTNDTLSVTEYAQLYNSEQVAQKWWPLNSERESVSDTLSQCDWRRVWARDEPHTNSNDKYVVQICLLCSFVVSSSFLPSFRRRHPTVLS